jgi:phosphoserine phosphatase
LSEATDERPYILNVIGEDADRLFPTPYLPNNGIPAVLKRGRAFEIPFDGDPDKALDYARAANAGRGFDINVLGTRDRRKRILIADMDSTIITCECLDELADMAGLKAKVSAITERAMRGEIEFEGALRERVGLLRGLPLEALERVWRERVRLMPGARELVATMKANGAYTLLVSGGFTFFSARVAEAVGFDEHRSNVLIDDGKCLTGEVREPILGRAAKLEALNETRERLGLGHHDVLAVGDGANDLPMIQCAGLGVAYHAKPVVAEGANARIDHNDLRALLYLQGYRDDEIVGG